jgi:hypothetical protein
LYRSKPFMFALVKLSLFGRIDVFPFGDGNLNRALSELFSGSGLAGVCFVMGKKDRLWISHHGIWITPMQICALNRPFA